MNNNKKTICILLILSFLLSACASKPSDTSNPTETSDLNGHKSNLPHEEIEKKEQYQKLTDHLIITPIQGELSSAERSYAIISDGAHYGLQDIHGNILIDYCYDDLKFANIDEAVLLIAKKEDCTGVIDTNDQIIIPIQYPLIQCYGGKYLIAAERKTQSIDFTDESPTILTIFNAKGEKIGNYCPSEIHATTKPISILWHEGTAGDILCATATIYNSIGNLSNTSIFTDVIKPDGTLITTFEEFSPSQLIPDSLTQYTALYTKDVNVDIAYVVDSEGTVIGGGRFFSICGWDLDGHPIESEYHPSNGQTYYNTMDLQTGDEIEKLQFPPSRRITDSLMLFQHQIFDRNKNYIMDVAEVAFLLEDKILFKDTDTGIWHFVDSEGIDILDEKYIGGYVLSDAAHYAYVLERDDGTVILLSEKGDLLDDENLTIKATYKNSNSLEKTLDSVQYQGKNLELRSIRDGYITFSQDNSLVVFAY